MKQELNYEEAKSLSRNIQTSSNTMKELLDRSDSEVTKVESNWQGVSADYAIEDWKLWKKDFDEYYEMLLQNVKNIENACSTFISTESKMQQNYQQ